MNFNSKKENQYNYPKLVKWSAKSNPHMMEIVSLTHTYEEFVTV